MTLKGRVISSEDNQPLPGVAVLEKGTTNGTVTDIDGNYSLNVKEDGTIVVSFIGFATQEIAVAGQTLINVTLESDSKELDEIVAVGYGQMKKSDLTGSVVSVDRESMMKKSPTNIGQGLQGTAPGVIVTMQDGAPDSKAQIRIRGVATINGSAAPLYVVDGIQVGNNADFLAPSDIASVDVLKDASATAIYGAAGANGVIMITTKHGNKGKSNISIAADFGLQTLSRTLDVCSVDEYAANLRQARINDNQVDPETGKPIMWNPVWSEEYDGKRKAIDWQDQMTRSAWRQNYSISTTGGNDKVAYAGSLGFLRNDGIVVNSSYQRITGRANVKTTVNSYLEFGADLSFTHTDSHGSNSSVGNFGNLSSLRDFAFACPSMDFITSNIVTYGQHGVPAGTYVSPNVVNPNGTYGEVPGGKNFNDGFWGTTLGNMYAKQMENQARNRSNRALTSAYVSITPLKGLTWKTLVSYDYNTNSSNNFYGGVYTQRFNIVDGKYINLINGLAGDGGKGDAYYAPRNNNEYDFSVSNSENQTLYLTNTLSYHFEKGIHNVGVVVGNEISRWYGQWTSANAVGFESPNNREIGLTTNFTKGTLGNGGLNLESRGVSYFGRLNYTLMDRYLLTGTIRKDGSSNFGSMNHWGTFPSVALGWRVSQEDFMQNVEWIDNLKLRAGWGQTGNSGGATDLSVNGLNVDGKYVYYAPDAALGLGNNPEVVKGYYPVLKDMKLQWETNEQTNFGIDAAFLGSQFVLSVDYFIRNTKDLLLYKQIRASSGYTQLYSNYGEIQNRGLEIMLGWNKQFNDDFSLNITMTGSTLRNEVKKMGDPVYATNSDSSGQGTGDGSNTGAVGADGGYHWGNHSISMEGEAVGSFYGYRTDGIIRNEQELAEYKAKMANWDRKDNVKVGDYRFKDLNNDGKINESDREVLGNGFPAFNYGFNIGMNWKNFDANIQMHGVLGQKLFSYSAMRLTNMFASDDGCTPNILKDAAKNAWSPSNPNGSEARLSILDENYNMRASDAWVKDANFMKIANIQVGYNLPKSLLTKAQIQSARVYVGVQNVACFSKYNKYGDPECGQGSVLYTGLDTGRYPMPRTFNFGVNVTF